ncbi:MAG: DUF4982 domain-containing protein, partial [Erysipelotrichaceae bacterium]|nr:DUF4982 domain-containing protein [Erysipelotrichaceae bacterium]
MELFLNGRSLGKQTFTKVTTENGYTYQLCNGQLYMTWTVPYEDGRLWAVAYDENGNPIDNTVGRNITKTAGQATTIRVTPGQQIIDADGRSLNYILVEALDENGEVDPRADFEVTMSSQGEGVVIASENGDPNDTRNRKSAVRNLFFGKAVFIVQSTKNAGNVIVSAMADGLDAVSASFETRLPEEEDRPINTTYPKQLTDEMIQLIKDHLDYHGEPQSPEWTILEEALSENDLVIQGQTARDPGVYTMTITGKNNYTGTIQKTYEIVDRVLDGFVRVDG